LVYSCNLSNNNPANCKNHQHRWNVHLERTSNTSWHTANHITLMYPGIMAKKLFISNFLKHSTNNFFIMQLLSTNNPPSLHSMPNISYVKYIFFEISYIPNEQITIPIKSKNLYQFYLGNLPEKAANIPITREHWKTIWRNIASKHIPSGSRRFRYVQRRLADEMDIQIHQTCTFLK
jgi:hypothetical protein